MRYLLARPATAIKKIAIPTKTNDVWIPNSTEEIPNKMIPIISPSLEINSPTPEIVHSSLGSVQSEIYAEITGRMSESPSDIAKVIVIILRNHS